MNIKKQKSFLQKYFQEIFTLIHLHFFVDIFQFQLNFLNLGIFLLKTMINNLLIT